MARLAQDQTLVIMVKIGACRVKIYPAGENSGHGKNLIPCVKNSLQRIKIHSRGEKITISMLPMGNITY